MKRWIKKSYRRGDECPGGVSRLLRRMNWVSGFNDEFYSNKVELNSDSFYYLQNFVQV
jgi:hypothetical protein